MAGTPKFKRHRVYYSGQVQGVGFRYTACTIARPLEVTGYVRNLSDGRVELVAEGPPREVERFLDQIARRQEGRIRDVETASEAATGEFDCFEIRR
ncbi:acylphosphatase [Pirellulales bacterium]|nr:acylphosphatase [Pirellulales bacterium]